MPPSPIHIPLAVPPEIADFVERNAFRELTVVLKETLNDDRLLAVVKRLIQIVSAAKTRAESSQVGTKFVAVLHEELSPVQHAAVIERLEARLHRLAIDAMTSRARPL